LALIPLVSSAGGPMTKTWLLGLAREALIYS